MADYKSRDAKRRPRKRSNNRERSSKDNRRDDSKGKEYLEGEEETKLNDAAWYAAFPELLEGSASFSWLNPLGTTWSLNVSKDSTSYRVLNSQKAPGILTLSLIPGPGVSNDNTSPVNVASRLIYSWVRHANSGHSNYEHADLMMYLLGMDDIYSYYSMLVRAYGLANSYSSLNRYYPKLIIESLGIDFDDLIQNLAQFRYYINSLGARIGSFAVPANMSYFKRHQWLYSGVYLDAPSAKAQSYAFVPVGFRKYVETDGPGKLEFKTWFNGRKKIKDIIAYGNELMDAIALSEDCNIISGDIIKAFGVENLFKVAVLDSSYTVIPTFAPEVLSQIQNATIFPNSGTNWNVDITQNPATGSILYSPTTDSTIDSVYMGDRLVNMYKDNITPADTMVATRLTNIATPKDGGGYTFDSLGSEIVVEARMYQHDTNGDLISFPFIMANKVDTLATFNSSCSILSKLNAFDYHPMCLFMYAIESGKYSNAVRMFQINNYTTMGRSDLTKMHETALLSMFSCPQVAVASRP